MHRLAHDFLRRVRGDFLDIHAALGAGDDDGGAGGAVEQDGEVEFARNVHRLGDEDLADELALGSGLMRDERLAEHLARHTRRLARENHRDGRRP